MTADAFLLSFAGTPPDGDALAFGGDEFQTNFKLFLHVVSYYITPWLAVLLIDYFVVHRNGRGYPAISNFYQRDGAFGRYGSAGLTALIVGTAVSVPFMANDFYTGPIAEAMPLSHSTPRVVIRGSPPVGVRRKVPDLPRSPLAAARSVPSPPPTSTTVSVSATTSQAEARSPAKSESSCSAHSCQCGANTSPSRSRSSPCSPTRRGSG